MTWQATVRAIEAARKQQERESKKRQRELARQAKETARFSAQEQARLEVETYENAVEVLLSIHKEQTEPMDWLSLAVSLPPAPPAVQSHHELKTRQRLTIARAQTNAERLLEQATQIDQREYAEALAAHATDCAEWEKMSTLARRILNGDSDAYILAIQELSPFSELAGIGSSLHFTIHNAHLIEVVLSTNGRQAIPAELKTLTSAGRVSVKAMPRPRFVEIYQDYVCGCVLRVARELFALLPIQTLLIAACVETLDTATGGTVERPFLSVAIPRDTLDRFNFDFLDPSDAVLQMTHRGDLKASRKTGEFESISPLTVADIPPPESAALEPFAGLLAAVQQLRADLARQCATLTPHPVEGLFENGETP